MTAPCTSGSAIAAAAGRVKVLIERVDAGAEVFVTVNDYAADLRLLLEAVSQMQWSDDEATVERIARAMCPNQTRAWQDRLVVHSEFAPLEGQPEHPLLPRWTRYAGLARNLIKNLPLPPPPAGPTT